MLYGIARSMAPAGLKKALSFEAVRLASQERVQQRLYPGLCCEDQLFKDFAQDRFPQRLVEPRAADGGSVGGRAEDGVSSGIQRRPPRSDVPGANFCEDCGCQRSRLKSGFLSGARLSKCPRPCAR